MSFKSLFAAFRVTQKPGVGNLAVDNPVNPNAPNSGPWYKRNTNGDAACDILGSQWVRQADYPVVWGPALGANPNSLAPMYAPQGQRWDFFPDAIQTLGFMYFIARNNPPTETYPAAIYNVVATAEQNSPGPFTNLYLQIHTPNTVDGSVPVGHIPAFSVAIPDDYPRIFTWKFGVETPLNSLGGGAAIGISSNPDTWQLPNENTFLRVNVDWAYYSQVNLSF